MISLSLTYLALVPFAGALTEPTMSAPPTPAQIAPGATQESPFHWQPTTFSVESEGANYVLTIAPDESALMTEVIDLGWTILGIPVRYSVAEVADARLKIVGTMRIPKADFRAFWEGLLRMYDLLVFEVGTESQPVISVSKVVPGGHGTGPYPSTTVAFEDLETWRQRHALITTAIPLEHVQARNVMAALSNRFDNSVETIRNIENANVLLVTGRAKNIWDTAQLVAAFDRESQPPTPDVDERIELLAARITALEQAIAER